MEGDRGLESLVGDEGQEPCKKVTRRQLVMNLICGGLGTGMFSLPSSTAGSSLLPAFFMMLGMVALNAWTIMILVEAAEAKQVFDIGALLGLLPGRVLPGRLGRRLPGLGSLTQAFINCMVCVVCMISLISYLIVIYDSLQPFLGDILSRTSVVTLAALVMIPLCFLNQRYLSWSSMIAFLVNIYIIGLMIALYTQKSVRKELPAGACLLGVGKGVIAMLAVLGQCFVVQMCVLPMYQELEDRSTRTFRRCLLTAFAALTAIFGAFACLGYLTFGPEVEGNALKQLPPIGVAHVAQIGTILVVSALYPIMVIPMVAPVRNMHLGGFFECPGRPEVASRRRSVVTSVAILLIVLVSYAGALSFEELLVVNVIGGALCVGIFAGFAPGLVGLCLLETRSVAWKILMTGLIVFGIANAVIGVVFTSSYQEDIASHCAVEVLA